MDFLSTLNNAHASIKALDKGIDRVEEHARRMAGNSGTIPFEKTGQNPRSIRYVQCYCASAT